MLLARVPPNLLVGEGATKYAIEKGMEIFPASQLVSRGANDRWLNWKRDLEIANERFNNAPASPPGGEPGYPGNVALHQQQMHTPNSSPRSQGSRLSQASPPQYARPLVQSAADTPTLEGQAGRPDYIGNPNHPIDCRRLSQLQEKNHLRQSMARPSNAIDAAIAQSSGFDPVKWGSTSPSPDANESKKTKLSGTLDGASDDPDEVKASNTCRKRVKRRKVNVFDPLALPFIDEREELKQDLVTDTVGAIVVDHQGKLAAGSSSGGIGMKHKGRAGPAALVGVGTTVIPAEPGDPNRVSVATVTSGTGEHMATTMASHTCADRVYNCVRRKKGGGLEYASEDEALRSMIETDFMGKVQYATEDHTLLTYNLGHEGVRHSPCVGALGVMAVKSTKDGIFLYFGHNTESFVSYLQFFIPSDCLQTMQADALFKALASMSSNDNTPLTTMSRTHGRSAVAIGGRGMRTKNYRR